MKQLNYNEDILGQECTIKYTEKSAMYLFTKRLIDVLSSLIGLVVLSPILLILYIAIKVDSKGPALFKQIRIGKNGKEFYMYKFRSMVTDAEKQLEKLKEQNEMSGPMFKIKDDPRITKVGKFIRKTSLDELPQLINVLKGEMSLVGPRPSLPKEVAQFNERYMMRLIVKPGLTCYWQVLGRNNIGFEEWMELDLKYIRERSTWLDIKLIFKTIGVIFKGNGAS